MVSFLQSEVPAAAPPTQTWIDAVVPVLVGAAVALASANNDNGSGDIGSGFFEPPFIPPRPPFAPPPPLATTAAPVATFIPVARLSAAASRRWRICTTCFNARDPEYCRDTTSPCILDEPTWEQWQLATRQR